MVMRRRLPYFFTQSDEQYLPYDQIHNQTTKEAENEERQIANQKAGNQHDQDQQSQGSPVNLAKR